ncbi:MAG: hypothetical protein U1F66_04050 [bacterium]
MTGKVSGAFHPPEFNDAWLRRLDAPARMELSALGRETDAELYAEGLLNFASRREQAGAVEQAAELYARIAEGEGIPAALRQRARRRLDAVQGQGAFGDRAEFLMRNLARQATEPSVLLAMGAAGTAFRVTRLATLSRLATGSSPGFPTRFLGAGRLASLLGFAAEAPTFTLVSRLGSEALGRPQDWSLPAVGRDLASSYLVLGALKFSGALGSAAVARAGARPMLGTLFQQGAMLTGILLGHRLEEAAGLRPHRDGATTLTDSLALLLQFHIAGRLSGSLFGENFRHWERGLEHQAGAIEQVVSVPGPRLVPALAPAGVGGREFRPPLAMAMSTSDFDPKIFGPVGRPRPQEEVPVGRGEEAAVAEPVSEFRRTVVLRTWRSAGLGDGERVWSYELVLEDLESLLQPGAERVIARRNGGEMKLQLVETDVSSGNNPYVVPGTPYYRFLIREGESLGLMTIFLEKGQLQLFNIQNTEGTQNRGELLPGAGTMVLDWLASQAAMRGDRFSILDVINPRIFHILKERSLFSRFNLVEFCQLDGKNGHRINSMAPLENDAFRARHWQKGFFNVRGNANPELLVPELRAARVLRGFSGDKTELDSQPHPFELRIEPFRNFLVPGHEAVIAEREGRELRFQTQSVEVRHRASEFIEPGAIVLKGALSEGGEGRGSMTVYLHPDRLELFMIETKSLPQGAGTLAMEWLATQAAIHRRDFGVLAIENPHILRILSRNALLDPESLVQLAFRNYSGIEARPLGALRDFPQLPVNPFADFLLVRGRPNPELVPLELRKLPKG